MRGKGIEMGGEWMREKGMRRERKGWRKSKAKFKIKKTKDSTIN